MKWPSNAFTKYLSFNSPSGCMELGNWEMFLRWERSLAQRPKPSRVWESPEINHKNLLAWAMLYFPRTLERKSFQEFLIVSITPKSLKNQCSTFSHWVMLLSELLDYLVPQFFHLSNQNNLIPIWHTFKRVSVRWDKVCVFPPPFSPSERASAIYFADSWAFFWTSSISLCHEIFSSDSLYVFPFSNV